MAKTNKAAIISLCNAINKKEGLGALYSLDSENASLKIKRWSTGIEDLDNIIGGGMPEGRVVEIFGAESSGKTTLLYHLCAQHDLCLDIPIEGTFDAERAKIFGNKPKQMLIYRARYGEDALNKTMEFSRFGIPLIGIDSIPSLVPRADIEKINKAVTRGTVEEQRIGGIPSLLNKYLPSIEDVIEVTGTTLICVNQIRDTIGAMPFAEQTHTPGGHKAKHSFSLRIQVARRAWIEIPNKDPKNTAKTEKIGMILKCKVVKSKICNPMGECEIPLIFERGFISFADLPKIKKEIADRKAAEYKGKKGKSTEDEWEEDGEEWGEGDE